MRNGRAIGSIGVWRARSAAVLATAQIALLQTFADQAVIAIENVRLFNELEARTAALTRSVGELKALGEVGQAVSSTLDLETVLSHDRRRAPRELTGMDGGSIYEYDEVARGVLPALGGPPARRAGRGAARHADPQGRRRARAAWR